MHLGNLELDPRKLIYFVTIIEHGSLKKAAKFLDISQPALSASMSRLEADVGQKLMERGPSGVAPTRFGDLIYAHARLIRDELKLLERHMIDRRGRQDTAIRFGALPSLSVTVIPRAVGRWRNIRTRACRSSRGCRLNCCMRSSDVSLISWWALRTVTMC
ncbi:LysR family transcriptional regulator [Rhizobium leguminosarum]|nr:LysR family transcriptional regulator [Rhizobium leguminosarum]MBY5856316.1 LysR family transcriptional regulator [Rhizobium leguminosarum]